MLKLSGIDCFFWVSKPAACPRLHLDEHQPTCLMACYQIDLAIGRAGIPVKHLVSLLFQVMRRDRLTPSSYLLLPVLRQGHLIGFDISKNRAKLITI